MKAVRRIVSALCGSALVAVAVFIASQLFGPLHMQRWDEPAYKGVFGDAVALVMFVVFLIEGSLVLAWAMVGEGASSSVPRLVSHQNSSVSLLKVYVFTIDGISVPLISFDGGQSWFLLDAVKLLAEHDSFSALPAQYEPLVQAAYRIMAGQTD